MTYSGGQAPTKAGRRAHGQVEPVVYWVRADGEIMLAPHTGMKPFRGWVRFEASTVKEIEIISRRMREQEELKIRGMNIQSHLRHMQKWDEQEARIRLHRASGYRSQNDQIACERVLKNINRRRDTLNRLLFSAPGEFLTGSFEIEKHEEKVGMAQYANTAKTRLSANG